MMKYFGIFWQLLNSIICLLLFILIVHSQFEYFNLKDNSIKVSFLVFGIFFLIRKLLTELTSSNTFEQLERTINDLSFDVIKPDAALKQLRILEFGLTFNDYINPNLDLFFKGTERIKKLISKSSNLVNEINSDKKLYNKNSKIIDELLDQIEKEFVGLNKQFNIISRKVINVIMISDARDEDPIKFAKDLQQWVAEINSDLINLRHQFKKGC